MHNCCLLPLPPLNNDRWTPFGSTSARSRLTTPWTRWWCCGRPTQSATPRCVRQCGAVALSVGVLCWRARGAVLAAEAAAPHSRSHPRRHALQTKQVAEGLNDTAEALLAAIASDEPEVCVDASAKLGQCDEGSWCVSAVPSPTEPTEPVACPPPHPPTHPQLPPPRCHQARSTRPRVCSRARPSSTARPKTRLCPASSSSRWSATC